MATNYNLINLKDNYLRIKDDIYRIEIITNSGERHGIGNPAAIKAIFDAIINELDRQINE